jgi:hypothetical protein
LGEKFGMFCVLNAEDHEFNPRLDKTKDYNLGILYFFKTNTG